MAGRVDHRIKCKRCKHVLRFHEKGGGRCKAAGCKGCRAFQAGEVSLGKIRDYVPPVAKSTEVTPRKVAEHLAEGNENPYFAEMMYGEIIWNPGFYYRAYRDIGGAEKMSGWVLLCQNERITPMSERSP